MMSIFRSFVTSVLIIGALLLSLQPGVKLAGQEEDNTELVDGIAAVVNGDVITFSQVREVVAARERVLRSMYTGTELVEKVREARTSALQDLIDRQLIIQDFKSRELQIPDRMLDQRMKELIMEQFGGDREAFLKTLQAQGFTVSSFREMEREKIIVQAMRQQNVRRDVLISPKRIENYYSQNRSEYATPEQVKLRLIKISKKGSEEGSNEETQRAIAEEIRGKLASGGDFERMAQMYSDDSTRDVGGDWGWIERDTLTAKLTEEIFKLRAGEISRVIELGDFYYILMVEARKNSSTRPLSEVRNEIESQLLQEERLAKQEEWMKTLRDKAYIKMF